MEPVASPERYEDEIDLLRYGRFLAAYWLVLLLAAAAGAAVGVLIAVRPADRFQASATLAVTPPGGTAVVTLTPQTARVVLANLTLISQTLSELQLDRAGITPQWFVDNALVVQPIPATNLVRFSVSLPDPTAARRAVELLSAKAIELSRALDQQNALAAREAFKIQRDEAVKRLREVEQRLVTFQKSSHVDLMTADVTATLDRRRELGRVTIVLEAEKARLAALVRQRATADAEPQPPRREIAEGPSVGEAKQALLDLEVAATQASVAGWEQRRRATKEGASGSQAVNGVNALYGGKLELASLEAEYDVAKKAFTDLAARYEEASGRAITNTPQLLIVDAAVQPDRPLARRTPQFAIVGSLVGLAAGILAALLINRRRAVATVAEGRAR